MYKAVIFDLDGTLVDSLPDIGRAANIALQYFSLRNFSVSEYKSIAGGGHRRLLTKAITLAQDGTPPSPDLLDLAVAIKKYHEDGPHGHDETAAFPRIHAMLRSLIDAGLRLAILSNKNEPTVRRIVSRIFPDIDFVYVAGAREDTPLKPDPSAAITIAEKYLKVPKRNIAFIGDTDIDMKTARAAGFTPVGVPWGCRSEKELYANGAVFVPQVPEDIVDFLCSDVNKTRRTKKIPSIVAETVPTSVAAITAKAF